MEFTLDEVMYIEYAVTVAVVDAQELLAKELGDMERRLHEKTVRQGRALLEKINNHY